MRPTTVAAAGALLLTLTSCSRLLILADRSWWDAAGGDAALRKPILRETLRRGWLPRFAAVQPQENARDRLVAELSAGRFRAALVGPLLSADVREPARRFPSVTFLLYGGASEDDELANTVQLVFDRRQAFSEAGAAAAARAGGASAVGVLIAAERQAGPEVQAFIEATGGDPIVRALPPAADAAAVRSAAADLGAAGARVILARLAGGGAAFLQALAPFAGAAIVEDWAASGLAPDQVLLSIEEDLVGGLGACLEAVGRGAQSVSGPVRIVEGEAKP